MSIVSQASGLDENFSDAFFAALETDALEPSEQSQNDRIEAARAEIAGIARNQKHTEWEGEKDTYL